MAKMRNTLVLGGAVLLLTLGTMGSAYGYSDVISGMESLGVTRAPEMSFAWSAVFHQDTIVTSGLIEEGAGDMYQRTGGGNEGYITLANPNPGDGLDTDDRVVLYGGGNLDEVNVRYDGARRYLPVDSTLKMALGNLGTAKVELMPCGGDTATDGTATATDSITGASVVVPSVKFTDANKDGILMFKTTFDFNVVEGANEYYDRNRDGEVHDARLTSDPARDQYDPDYAKSDRPFIAIYESEGPSAGRMDVTNPADFNADNDAVKSTTDNLWVGNPYAPVDADYLGGPRGDDGDPSPGVAEADPTITDVSGFGDPLLIGELKGLYLITIVNLNRYARWSQACMITTGRMDVELTDGRLYDWYYNLNGYDPDLFPYYSVLAGHMLFNLGGDPLHTYEYTKSDVDLITDAPVPEPAAGLVFLGSIVGLGLRRRRRT